MRHAFRVALFLIPLFSMTACISSRNVSEGIASFHAQDYRNAFIRLKPAAERGQPDAAYAIGYMYYYGRGVIENRQIAWMWIKRAAHSGQPQALAALRILHDGQLGPIK